MKKLKEIKLKKRLYTIIGILYITLGLSLTKGIAQTVSDFESLALPPNSYWNGDDLSGIHNTGIFHFYKDSFLLLNNQLARISSTFFIC